MWYVHTHTHTGMIYIQTHWVERQREPGKFYFTRPWQCICCMYTWYTCAHVFVTFNFEYLYRTHPADSMFCVCVYVYETVYGIDFPPNSPPFYTYVSCSGRIYSSNSRQGKNCTTLGIKCIQNIVSCICIRKILITDNTI